MAKRNTTIEGMNELKGALAALGKVPTYDNIIMALTAGAFEILNQAKQNAPVITGTLRRSLHIGDQTDVSTPPDQFGEGENSDQYSDIGKGARFVPRRISVKIGTNLEYARFVEFGTVKQKENPFLRSAYDEKLKRAKDLSAISLVEIIKNELKNG